MDLPIILTIKIFKRHDISKKVYKGKNDKSNRFRSRFFIVQYKRRWRMIPHKKKLILFNVEKKLVQSESDKI